MVLSLRKKFRPFGNRLKRGIQSLGSIIIKGSSITRKLLKKGIPIAEQILGFAEKVPIPQVQQAVGIGRQAVQVAKQIEKGAGEVERFAKKLRDKPRSTVSRVRELTKLASELT